ncbi:hypothetical protein [Paramicrobacterium chengjingii]|uniref:hypothetical protein n=1 Tax=Paramicrobacterium chengjingii TaxID=2769067 RepID=UPI001424366C|nr:hypothetical protein [Microbacterium chengjingii]
MTDGWTTHIETRSLGDIAREEIEAAKSAGVDPMDIARTHQRLGYIIPRLIEQAQARREQA